mmetsp:Transcript_15124/g.48132  ORF Transcript_15124/g.48132 Transcript_15124/m.48132 type:complete len:206 (+) Transcript_15124:199-816(+)
MGATLSVTEPNRLAVAAISHVVHFTRDTLLALEKELNSRSSEHADGNMVVTQGDFAESLRLVEVHPDDKEILDRLFILYDRAGDGIVNVHEFLVGMSLLVKAKPREKLLFSLEIYDRERTGSLDRAALLQALQWLSRTASFFGDRPPTQEALSSLAERVFNKIKDDEPVEVPYTQYVDPIVDHPLLEDFIAQSEESERLQQEPID